MFSGSQEQPPMNAQSVNQMVRAVFFEETYKEVDRSMDDVVFIDFSTENLEKSLRSFKDMKFSEQLAYIGKLSEILERLDDKVIFELLPKIIKDVVQESSQIIMACLGQVVQISEVLQCKGNAGYRCIVETITPFLRDLVRHSDPDTKEQARVKQGEIAPVLSDDDRGFHILPICLELVHDVNEESNKLAGLKLQGQLSPLFTADFLQGFVGCDLVAQSQDMNKNIRIAAVHEMASIGKLFSIDFVVTKFYPELKKLSQDRWEVRLSIVESIDQLSYLMPEEIRAVNLSQFMQRFIEDDTRWVREAALAKLGHFLSTQTKENMNEKLFGEYIKMPKSVQKLNKDVRLTVLLECAQTYPKILEVVGISRWPQLKSLFIQLLGQDDMIRLKLAGSQHRVAKVLGRELTETDLVNQVSKNLLGDKSSNNVKNESIKNLAMQLEVLDKDKRERFADIYSGLQSDMKKWRIRQIIAGQLGILSRLFSEETTTKIIIPIAFKLCKDDVASVRYRACAEVHYILENLKDFPQAKMLIVENIKSG